MFRKAVKEDLDYIEGIFDRIHDAEERGEFTIGWNRKIYPLRSTAEAALERDDLFVEVEGENPDGVIVGLAIINQIQVDSYYGANWDYPAADEEIMVLHTLVIDPERRGSGYGPAFVEFYEKYAAEHGCPYLRMDTNERNALARKMYSKLGYNEVDMVPCVFNGIPGVNLILLEKKLDILKG